MPGKRKQHFEFETIHLERHSSETQYQQLEAQIRDAIAQGMLAAKTRIPSSRSLSKKLGVSRNTVLFAYQQLISEGYLESKRGSGTTVSAVIPESLEYKTPVGTSRTENYFENDLSESGQLFAQHAGWLPQTSKIARPFRPHLSALDQFPVQIWNRLMHEQSRWSLKQLEQCDPQGYGPLRESIAEYMRISRGAACGPEQVLITSGAQQGVSLVAQMLLNPGDTVWIEEPGNAPANQLLGTFQARLKPIRVDSQGMDISFVDAKADPPKLICVTPSSQWPLAMTMSLNRRMQLLSTSRQHQSWILEDDYNGEYRYSGRPLPTVYSLDQSGRTIYMGTFSKLLFPAIRLGYLIVPESLSQTFAYARWLTDRYSAPLPQMVLHRFIESGQFLKHVRQMRSLYLSRQKHLYNQLTKRFKENIELTLPESGMHLVVRGKTKAIEKQLTFAAEKAGVEFHSVKMYSREQKSDLGLILGFAAFDEKAITKAVSAWARAFNAR